MEWLKTRPAASAGRIRDTVKSAALIDAVNVRSAWRKANLGLWTMSTLLASDWAVHRPDWLGLPLFSGLPSVCKGWNPVRVPPRARVFPVQGLFGAFSCGQFPHSCL